jgi:hypothetical protein
LARPIPLSLWVTRQQGHLGGSERVDVSRDCGLRQYLMNVIVT